MPSRMQHLIDNPLFRPEDLGRAIPDSPHAVSVCLPTWRDNVGYEEGEPRVIERLRAGYPRFVYNPICRELFDLCRRRFAAETEGCQVYPTLAAADRFCRYFQEKSGEPARLRDLGVQDLRAVLFPLRHERIARDYWQHAGEGVSSRCAAAYLDAEAVSAGRGDVLPVLRERIARLTAAPARCVCLFPSGMAAIAAVARALSQMFPGCRTAQFGFPYVDTLKIQQKFGAGVRLFAGGSGPELDALSELLAQEPLGGIFTEVPSNPLLGSPDLDRLTELARRHGCPLIVDETVGSFINVDVLSAADVVCTSLTKFFSGVGDVMGGAVILNPDSQFFHELSIRLIGEGEPLIWEADLDVLERNSRDFEERVRGINARAERLAEFLREHPRIRQVYYPKFEPTGAYRSCQRAGGGFGGLLSLTLEDEAVRGPRFFDALRVCKGPNLGMTYTLACPYTILAHYSELDFAESCGMSRYLVRISVGLEDADDLIERFDLALTSADERCG